MVIKIDPNEWPTIDQFIENKFFDDVRSETSFPKSTDIECELKEYLEDLIARYNVHKLISREEIIQAFKDKFDKLLSLEKTDHYAKLIL